MTVLINWPLFLIENLDVERILKLTEDWRVRLGSEAGTSQTIESGYSA